jgi:ribulose 1,5-bisphosphate synthetase/thiazole synthase
MSDGLKSAYELAMEKLRARDKEKGIAAEETALTGAQKKRIAEVRSQAKAKLAELEILWQSKRAELVYNPDPEVVSKAEQDYVAERARVEEKAEASVEKIRREKKSSGR